MRSASSALPSNAARHIAAICAGAMLLEQDRAQAKALGSAHLCGAKTFRRWKNHDPWGWTLRGQFWGAKGQRIGTRFCLSGEDIARGVAVFGPQGSGKTQCVILPAIADRMRDGHSLIVTDVQGELQPYIQKIAAITGHAVVVHNPSQPEGSCAINLCDWVDNVADARSMAAVLLSEAYGRGDPFWARAAVNLLAACALHYPTFGQVLEARQHLHEMAKELAASQVPGAADLAELRKRIVGDEPAEPFARRPAPGPGRRRRAGKPRAGQAGRAARPADRRGLQHRRGVADVRRDV